MKKFLETTYGKVVLCAVVAAIWGVNIINFSGMGGEEEEARDQLYLDIEEGEYTVPVFLKYTYDSSATDPFRISSDYRVQNDPHEPVEEEEYQKPILFLTGVMDGLAILLDNHGQTYFVEENDTFNNILVKSVYADSLLLVHEGNEFTINLN
jgi:hypothetical protein